MVPSFSELYACSNVEFVIISIVFLCGTSFVMSSPMVPSLSRYDDCVSCS